MYGGYFGVNGARPNPDIGREALYSKYRNGSGEFETSDINIAYQYRTIVEQFLNQRGLRVEVIEIE